MLKSTETILTNWNQYFNYNCKEEFSGISFDEIFNSYLISIISHSCFRTGIIRSAY